MLKTINNHLIDNSCHKKANLHEHEVCSGVEDGQVGVGQVVVKAIKECGDHVVGHDDGVRAHLFHQFYHRMAEKS